METRQFCSVCKEWLEMGVVQTNDGDDDDGVVWFRCPQCQGFLPKLMGSSDLPSEEAPPVAPGLDDVAESEDLATDPIAEGIEGPVDLKDGGEADLQVVGEDVAEDVTEDVEKKTAEDKEEKASEPLDEYAALLADKDPAEAIPYRPWESYEVGQCLHHLAWDDCGVVVAKENLPGGREVIKVYFEEAGVVRLIEKAPR